MQKTIIKLSMILLLSFAGPVYAGLDEGISALERDGYNTSLKEIKSLANKGNAKAQFVFAQLYELGHGVERDRFKAIEWYQKAANQGHIDAHLSLSALYTFGGEHSDDAKAVYWTKKAANQGSARAQHSLGVMYYDGRGVENDYFKAVDWFRKAANQEYATAQNWLAYMYENGLAVRKSRENALKWYGKACDNRSREGCSNFAKLTD